MVENSNVAKANVAKAIEVLEHHQLKKVLERAKAGEGLTRSDLRLLERLKSDEARLSANAPPARRKPKRGRPAKLRQLAEKIERLTLEKILERQERGERLTAADYAFLEKVKQAELEHADATKVRPNKPPLAERLQAFKENLFDSLCWVAENSKSHMARVTAAQTLKTWADDMEPPLEPYRIVEARPMDAHVVPVRDAI